MCILFKKIFIKLKYNPSLKSFYILLNNKIFFTNLFIFFDSLNLIYLKKNFMLSFLFLNYYFCKKILRRMGLVSKLKNLKYYY